MNDGTTAPTQAAAETTGSPASELVIRRRAAPGSSPGTLVADPDAPHPEVHVIGYGPQELQEAEVEDTGALAGWLDAWPVVWINVYGLGDVAMLERAGGLIGMHRLALEDVINVHQRPKVEDYEEHLFVVTRMIAAGAGIETEQMSLFLGRNYVVTLQERPGDGFGQVRLRLKDKKGTIRASGPDYLAYALLDAIIDNHFPVLERYGEVLEDLELDATEHPTPAILSRIHRTKRELMILRRAIWPQREMIRRLLEDDHPFVTKDTRVYLRDSYDHTVQLIELLETYRELASSLMDIYNSAVSNRLNEIMKVLTMIATIFIPLTFIAGIYGMNFDTKSPWNMPELGWAFGYVLCLGLMAVVAVLMVLYFRRKRWL